MISGTNLKVLEELYDVTILLAKYLLNELFWQLQLAIIKQLWIVH